MTYDSAIRAAERRERLANALHRCGPDLPDFALVAKREGYNIDHTVTPYLREKIVNALRFEALILRSWARRAEQEG